MNSLAKENTSGRCELIKSVEISALHTSNIVNMKSGHGSSWESHNFWELALVLKGVLTATVEKEVFNINENYMMFHPPMVYHRHTNTYDENLKFIILLFDANIMPVITNSIYVVTPEDVQ